MFNPKKYTTQRKGEGVTLEIKGKKYFIKSNFRNRVAIEELLNDINNLTGLKRKNLLFFISHYFEKSDHLPAETLKKIIQVLIPDVSQKSLDKINHEEALNLSVGIGFFMVECFSGGEQAKKFLAEHIKRRTIKKRRTMVTILN